MENKTDYKKRLKLLSNANKSRLVIRRSNKYIISQIIKYNEKGDITLAESNSKELKKFGWKFSCKNIPSAYLTGLILGKKVANEKFLGQEMPLDIGRFLSVKNSRLYGCLKGCLDSGLKIPCSVDILPSDDRIHGKHISDEVSIEFEKVKEKISKT